MPSQPNSGEREGMGRGEGERRGVEDVSALWNGNLKREFDVPRSLTPALHSSLFFLPSFT